MAGKPIFFDATGRRAINVTRIGWVAAILSTLLGVVFIATLAAVPRMSEVALAGRMTAIHRQELARKAVEPGLLRQAARLAGEARARRARLLREWQSRPEPASYGRALPPAMKAPAGRSLSVAFYPSWQASAFDSLTSALPSLDWVMPTWLSVSGPDMSLSNTFDQRVLDEIRKKKPSIAILPVIQNATAGKWDGEGLARLLSNDAKRKALIQNITTFVGSHGLQGLTVDFEAIPTPAFPAFKTFLGDLSDAFAERGWIVAVASPFANDAWPYKSIAHIVDYTILMAYDEHNEPDEAGSITGQSWFETTLDKRMQQLAPSRTLIAIGNYAYDWNNGEVQSLTFKEAIVAAHDSEADIDFDDQTNNPHFSYLEDDHVQHEVWLLDAVTAYNQIHAADPYKPAGYALWRLGSEDPSVWSVMGRPYDARPPERLANIPLIEDIDFEGEGEFLRVEFGSQSGSRTFETDAKSGDITDETYTKLPTGYIVRQFGAAGKKIALTFDDGPDATWTPKILDILKAEKVPAAFFIIGSNAEANPGLVQRMLAEGHEIGNHTFTHPNLAVTPSQAVKLELNATQRLFQALTGRSLRLFRPPYLGDAEPSDFSDMEPVAVAQSMGYLTVGEHVDPLDWQSPPPDQIIQRTLDQVHAVRPDMPRNIILLHDAGGDRAQTVAALPGLIERLKTEGYQFVPVSELAGLTRDQVMPVYAPTLMVLADRVVFMMLSAFGHALHACFLAAIWLSLARLLFLAGLSLWDRRRALGADEPMPGRAPFLVSVVIPAYNEANVIAATVQGILASTHRNMEVIVIDDGSADATADIVGRTFSDDKRVVLLQIPNGGKANALNVGLNRAQGEIIVALDADTQFEHDTVARLVRWFEDPTIGAVAGNAKVGNRINMITRWQALEYIVAQNFERRALAALGTLTVVPGAVGAWRRNVLIELGGFPADTMAEDQDLTIALQAAGHRVKYDSSAVAWTEAPTTVSGLAKQRFRWAYGTLQCLWKYRQLMFKAKTGALGMIALPQVWLFQIILTTLAPLADLLLLWQLVWQGIASLEHGAEFSNGNFFTIAAYYVAFVVVDLVVAIAGFAMERGEDRRLLWWLMLQRFGYRQIMYYVVVKSIWVALRGPFVGWGKLERTATVNRGLTGSRS